MVVEVLKNVPACCSERGCHNKVKYHISISIFGINLCEDCMKKFKEMIDKID